MFTFFTDRNKAPIYIKTNEIKAVYFDEDEKSTVIVYSLDNELYIAETVNEAMRRIDG